MRLIVECQQTYVPWNMKTCSIINLLLLFEEIPAMSCHTKLNSRWLWESHCCHFIHHFYGPLMSLKKGVNWNLLLSRPDTAAYFARWCLFQYIFMFILYNTIYTAKIWIYRRIYYCQNITIKILSQKLANKTLSLVDT